ncbi:MAG: hydroxylamine reductase, partial [Fidelibacterota bacterium]
SMFCFQCQETAKNQGCTVKGVCGKPEPTAKLQDLLIHTLKGISLISDTAGKVEKEVGQFIIESLFMTITNANFNDLHITQKINEAVELRDELLKKYNISGLTHDSVTWQEREENYVVKAAAVGILSTENEDVRSLRETLIIGLKGIAAYADHALILGYSDDTIFEFVVEALASTTKDLETNEMIGMVLKAGEFAVKTMALLDKANTETYGNPEITEVNIGVKDKPGILISGHDLKDMEQLLEQTKGTGVDVYTHSEMLPANYYPAFKKYDHFVGNYGNAWWKQKEEFDSFNGPILMTTNCIVPPKESYKDRIFTTGNAGFTSVKHIKEVDGEKNFSEIIELAKKCDSPTEIEKGTIIGGFAHAQVMALADKVVDAVKSGAIKKFVVMAGCDGRHKTRQYFTDVARELPKDTVILTAGCAKYRYNKLQLGHIGGIPRVLDAGQCNDSYSLAVIAMKLQEAFELEDINDLPLAFDIAWYEQKAVAVLLALLHLGFKKVRIGPTLPAFLSPNVAKVLVDTFDLQVTGEVEEDIKKIMAE